MKKFQDLTRKVVATIVAVTVMCTMLWFAYTMLITTPIFEGTLRMVLLACIGMLSLATVYFLLCKILEIIALLRAPSPAELKRREISEKDAQETQAILIAQADEQQKVKTE